MYDKSPRPALHSIMHIRRSRQKKDGGLWTVSPQGHGWIVSISLSEHLFEEYDTAGQLEQPLSQEGMALVLVKQAHSRDPQCWHPISPIAEVV